MGVDIYILDSLLRYRTSPRQLGDVLMVGRQGLHIYGDAQAEATQILQRYDARSSWADIGEDYTAEKLFYYLGARSVQSIDYSAYEGAEILHDLNHPVPKQLEDRFDFIFDGGTLEHVFNVAIAFDNMKAMLRKNGVYLGYLPADGLLGHGFYQFSPELLWRVFSEENGFTVEKMVLQRLWASGEEPLPPIEAKDPAKEGARQEIGHLGVATMIIAAARKTGCGSKTVIQQSDWVTTWDRSGAELVEEPALSPPESAQAPGSVSAYGKFEQAAVWLRAMSKAEEPGERLYAFGRLAAAMVAAEATSVEAATELVDPLAQGADTPLQALPLLAQWAEHSQAAARLLHRLAGQVALKKEEVLPVLRELAERDDLATIRELAQIWHERAPDEFTTALWEVVHHHDTVPDFARVPKIGAALAEMRSFRIRNTLSVLLGMNPKAAVIDEMREFAEGPSYIRLVPVSEAAEAEWAALNAAEK